MHKNVGITLCWCLTRRGSTLKSTHVSRTIIILCRRREIKTILRTSLDIRSSPEQPEAYILLWYHLLSKVQTKHQHPSPTARTIRNYSTEILPLDGKNQFAWWVRPYSPYHLRRSPDHKRCRRFPDPTPSSSRSLKVMLVDKGEACTHWNLYMLQHVPGPQ